MRIMKEIEGMGHEVGYHYEVREKTKGDEIGYPDWGWKTGREDRKSG